MINIAIIGVGNLGMRHAQAITKLKHKLTLFLVDPRIESLEMTKELLSSEYSIEDGVIANFSICDDILFNILNFSLNIFEI